jgi:hypothetical protein
MKILSLNLILKFEKKMKLSTYDSSKFRGFFGNILKSINCHNTSLDCKLCSKKYECPYSFIFETIIPPSEHRELRGRIFGVHPYILYVENISYRSSDTYSLRIMLMGSAIELISHVLLAFELMGKRGIFSSKIKFDIVKIYQFNIDGKVRSFGSPSDCCENFEADEVKLQPLSISRENIKERLTLKFITPLRIMKRGNLIKDPSIYDLMTTILRRLTNIFNLYGDEEDYIFQSDEVWEFLHFIDNWKIIDKNLKFKDHSRISRRQKREVSLSGMVGDMTIAGNVRPYNHLFKLISMFSLGKCASYGNGRIEYSIRS